MIDRGHMARLLERLLDTVEREASASSVDGRAKAQDDILIYLGEVLGASGVRDVLRRRMIDMAEDRAPGTTTSVSEFGSLTDGDAAESDVGRVKTRALLARRAVDDASILGPKFAEAVARQFTAANEGREGWLLAPEKKAGVEPETGLAETIRQVVVGRAGYTAGVRSGRASETIWLEAKGLFDRLQDEARKSPRGLRAGFVVESVSRQTIRTWCQRKGTPLANLYEGSRAEGLADRASGDIDEKRMLPR